jgi:hypothetical protein
MFAARICAVVCLMFSLTGFALAQDLKAEDVIAKHLSSIGTAEKRKKLKNILLLGFSLFESKLPERKSSGKMLTVSDASNLLFISCFASENYPFEKIVLFDGKINIPFVISGVRSPLGAFLLDNPGILKTDFFRARCL